MTPVPSYTVTSLSLATQVVPGPQAFWMREWHNEFEIEFQVLVVRSPGVVLLINSGLPSDLEPLNAGIRARIGERFQITAHEDILDALLRLEIKPDDVTHVTCTPLQGYATGGLLHFPNAQILLSRRGWLAFESLGQHPHDSRERMFTSEVLAALQGERSGRMRLLDDEDEIVPGVTTWWAGAHHRSSIVVEITTTDGTVAATDCFFLEDNVLTGIPPGMTESLDEAAIAYARLRGSEHILAGLYDPATHRRFPAITS